MRIYDPQGLLEFVKKATLNAGATSPDELYDADWREKVADLFLEYPKHNIVMNFRFGKYVDDTVLERIRDAADIKDYEKEALIDSREESYALISPNYGATINNLGIFLSAIGDEQLAVAILQKIALHMPLTIRNERENELLIVRDGKVVYNQLSALPQDGVLSAPIHSISRQTMDKHNAPRDLPPQFKGRDNYHEMLVMYQGLDPFAQNLFHDTVQRNIRKLERNMIMPDSLIQSEIERYLNETAIVHLRELVDSKRRAEKIKPLGPTDHATRPSSELVKG